MEKNTVIFEIRPAAGGGEAKIWAQDLVRMYTRYANINGWKVTVVEPLTIKITGANVFDNLHFETGVHRVQRIPDTEKRGRIHTSTATVAVVPQIPEHEIKINPQELEWEFFRSSGHGGQNVNKVSSAVRVRHKPTGLVVTSQTQRDQYQNRKIALQILASKIWGQKQEKNQNILNSARSAIGRGMRAEKIRTYNFSQNRVTDHRLNKSWYSLEAVIDGDLSKITKLLKEKLPKTTY